MLKRVETLIDNFDFSKTFIYDDFAKREVSYNQYFFECITLAKYIDENVINDSIIVIMENSYELSQFYFSVMMTKKKIMVIDPQKGNDEIKGVLVNISQTVVVVDDKLANNSYYGHLVLTLSDLSKELLEGRNDNLDVKKQVIEKMSFRENDLPFLVTYTSGTSGVTKGVVHTLNNLFETALALNDKIKIIEKGVFLHVMPMTYMAGILNSLIGPFIAGNSIVLTQRFSIVTARKFWDVVIFYKANIFWLSPSMLLMIDQLDRSDRGALYCRQNGMIFLVGTAALTNKTRNQFNNRYGVNVYASYGLSETLFISVETDESLNLSEGNSVGELLKGVDLRLDENNEIRIKVPWMFLGYTNENTESYFNDGFYMSGDIAKLDKLNLYITGRSKDLIIKGGMNLSPTLIEAIVIENDEILECAVIGVFDKTGEEKICCVYVNRNKDFKSDETQIRKLVLNRLGKNYMVDYFWNVKALSRNINGKIDRNLIRIEWEAKNVN